LWLVEVGHYLLDNLVFVTRCNDDLRAGVQGVHLVAVQVVEYVLQGLHGGEVHLVLIRHPLLHVQLLLVGVGLLCQQYADVIQAFEGAYRGSAYGYRLASVGKELFDGTSVHGNVFSMHLVTFYLFALHGLEGSCPYV